MEKRRRGLRPIFCQIWEVADKAVQLTIGQQLVLHIKNRSPAPVSSPPSLQLIMLLIVGAFFATAAAQFNNPPDVLTWCGKAYQSRYGFERLARYKEFLKD